MDDDDDEDGGFISKREMGKMHRIGFFLRVCPTCRLVLAESKAVTLIGNSKMSNVSTVCSMFIFNQPQWPFLSELWSRGISIDFTLFTKLCGTRKQMIIPR